MLPAQTERMLMMQKTIRITAAIATAFMGISLILLVISLLFQEVMALEFYGLSFDLVSTLPLFPVIPFFHCLLGTGCIILLIICGGNNKGGCWLEILILIVLAIVLPSISRYATEEYVQFISRLGNGEVAAYSVVSQISYYCVVPSNWGKVLAYVACGMSIAFKKLSKKESMGQ